jgi:hypothetical protein
VFAFNILGFDKVNFAVFNSCRMGKIATLADVRWEGWTVKQLRDELKARGLKVSGTKQQVVKRLYASDFNER